MSSTRSKKPVQKAPVPESPKYAAYRDGLKETLKFLNKGWINVRELAKELSMTRQAVYSRLSKLREIGYVIDEKFVRVGSVGPITNVFHCKDKDVSKIDVAIDAK